VKKIGKCPFCDGVVEQRKTEINGDKVSIYACSNTIYEKDEYEEGFFLSDKSTCNFQIFSNALKRYNKRAISEKEVKKLINNEECIVRLYSKKIWNEEKKKYGNEYFKYAVVDKDYGVSILFEEEVENHN
jgi:hypothetical protein